MQKKVLKVNPKDNVVVALVDLAQGETVTLGDLTYEIIKDTKAKHKFAAVDFEDGDHIIMYGVIVGKANQTIRKGEVITTENVKHQSAKVEGKTILLTGLVISEDGRKAIHVRRTGTDANLLGHELAQRAIAQGANEILSVSVLQ